MSYEASRERDLYKPIPLEIPSVSGWKEVPVKENGEPLVPVGPFSGNKFDHIFTSSIYYGERDDSPYGRATLGGSLATTFVRQEAAQQLAEAEQLLPPGCHLILMDTYRSLDVQQSLYDQYANALRRKHPNWSDEEISTETQKFVSLPSRDPSRPSPHNTGGSIDLAIYKLPQEIDEQVKEIIDKIANLDSVDNWQQIYKLEMQRLSLISKHAELLNFGTAFDYGGPEAALNFLEVEGSKRQLSAEEEEALKNRRLLYNVMMSVGFQPYADEWWHYNSAKSQMGAKTAGLSYAEYGAAELSAANLAHERMRQQHIKGTEILASSAQTKLGNQLNFDLMAQAAKSGADIMGEYRQTSLPEASVIEPPDEAAA